MAKDQKHKVNGGKSLVVCNFQSTTNKKIAVTDKNILNLYLNLNLFQAGEIVRPLQREAEGASFLWFTVDG